MDCQGAESSSHKSQGDRGRYGQQRAIDPLRAKESCETAEAPEGPEGMQQLRRLHVRNVTSFAPEVARRLVAL